jgi:ankyrin repeat protein
MIIGFSEEDKCIPLSLRNEYFTAARYGMVNTFIECITKKGISVKTRNGSGWTALHVATYFDQIEIKLNTYC